MKLSVSSIVSAASVLVLVVLISEYAPCCHGQVHHRFSGWRPGGKKRSDGGEVNSNTINIDRLPQPLCQTTEDQQIGQGESDILGDLRRAANRMRLLELFNLSKSRLNELKESTSNDVDDRPSYVDYLAAGL